MILRHFFLIGATLLSVYNAIAQTKAAPLTFSDKVALLKGRTVVFVLPEKEWKYMNDYDSLLSQSWTLTPFKVIKSNELEKYQANATDYAFFWSGAIQNTHNTYSGSSGFSNTHSYSNTHYSFDLDLPHTITKKGEIKSHLMAKVMLYAAFADKEKRNFTLPFMLAYLRNTQKNLSNDKNISEFDRQDDYKLKARLRKDTLYVPDSILYTRNKFTGKEKLMSQSFFKAYGGPYKFVSTAELISMIKNRDASKPLFLFEYVLSSTFKFVSVIEVNTGTMVHRRYSMMTYNIKEKDIKAILSE